MSPTAERIKAELAGLPLPERAELAHFLIESLDAQSGDEQADEAAFDAELMRRVEELRSDPTSGIPFEQFIKELDEKYK
jgi:putative addiction module component (TIGR02574 family)